LVCWSLGPQHLGGLRDPSQSPPFWTEEDERVFYTKFNNAEYDDGYFKLPQFTIPHLKKISHEIETNLMSDKDYGSMRKKGLPVHLSQGWTKVLAKCKQFMSLILVNYTKESTL
jgi:hypothetical protein